MIRRSIVAAVSLLAAAPAGAGQVPAPAGFCARLAADLGMAPAKPVGGKPAYEARALKGLGAALFGGTATVSMMLKPPAEGEIGDPRRFADACNAVANGVACAVTGPAVLEIAVKDKVARADARTGEAAQVSMIRNRVRCEER